MAAGSRSFNIAYELVVYGDGTAIVPNSGVTISNPQIIDASDGSIVLNTEALGTVNGGFPEGTYNVIAYDTISGEVVIYNGTNYYLLSNSYAYVFGANVTLDETSANYPYCFLTGTHIATPNGDVAVENLQVGDQVTTHDGKIAKVRFNFIQQKRNHIFANKEDLFPICIKANALADNVPSRDLYVTPDHAIYFPQWQFFAEAHTLRNGSSIYQVQDMPATFTYHHILCDNQEIVLAENTPAETFIDNVTMETFDNYAEYAALYPEEHFMEELDLPRAKSSRQLPRQFKQQLLDRAQMLYPVAKAA